MKLTGAQAVWEIVVREVVDVVFGMLGGSVIPLYDTLPEYPVHRVRVRRGQAAAHAADGYARATGRVGVCIATSGPGATNLVTGLATAYMDSTPVVAITGQVPTQLIGTDAFQEVDITGITMPITKHNYLVTDVHELPSILKEAFHIARTGRPGPVLVDIPKDVQTAMFEYDYPAAANLPSYHLPRPAASSQIERVARMINEAERPVIVAGHGVVLAGVEEGVRALVEKGALPLVTTLLGICTLPGSHPLCLGMAGMHGEAYANKALTEADLIVSLGSRFDDRLTGPTDKFRQHAKIVHIDVDPVEINKTVPTDFSIVGDLRDVVPALTPFIEARDRSAWLARIQEWRGESVERDILTQETDELVPQYVIRQLWEATQGKVIVVSDVGQNQMWEAQYYDHQLQRGLLTSGGLGTMGFALPAAIGAKLGLPDQPVWVVAGDGGFQMNIQELATVVQEQLPIKVALLNNGFLGMVRQWQQLFFDKRYSNTRLLGPDFARVAEAYGITGITVQEKGEVAPAIARAMETPGPGVIDFRVVQEEYVYPMVTPGDAISNMLRRPVVSEQLPISY